jgi:hypothetical protein
MLVHWPCFWMMVSATPCSLSAIAPPALRECTPMRSTSMPFLCSSSCLTACLRPTLMCVGVIVCQVPFSSMNSEIRLLSLPPLDRIWCTCHANAVTGPCVSFSTVSCIMVSPIRPFFWLVILRVHWSAVSSVSKDECRDSILLFLKFPMLPTVNCTVRVAQTVRPFLVMNLGAVYSHTLRR